ncbi:MAG TPA: hypothetical protein PLD27_05640 [bacterium]|nr:hypothetical protein [bacterium]HOL47603.1 hypothetical protein [bacterium]HPQ19403.1 hypothetical protein [bacterium]
MIKDLETRMNILKTDIKNLQRAIEAEGKYGSYDEWKSILQLARHLESEAIINMAIIKYREREENKTSKNDELF